VKRTYINVSILLAAATALAAPAFADDPAGEVPLAWQFKQGQLLRWTLDQTLQLRAPQEGKITETNFKMTVDFDVYISAVQWGNATLNVATSRVQADMEMPGLGKMSHDSAAPKAPAPNKGAAKGRAGDAQAAAAEPDMAKFGQEFLAEMLSPLQKLKFSVTVDKHGTVQTVRIDEKQKQALSSFRPHESIMKIVDKEGFSSAYFGGFIRFPPEKPAADQTWTSKMALNRNTPFGAGQIEHVLRRDGTATIDGKELVKLSADVKMSTEPLMADLMDLGKQSGEGVVYFDAKQGRVYSSQWKLNAQIVFGGGKAEGELNLESRSEIREREVKGKAK
jgi:hypothetical protein